MDKSLTIEARILIALTARRFDFTKVGRGALILDNAGNPTIDEHGQYSVSSEMYMVSRSSVYDLIYGLADNEIADATGDI